MNNIKNQKGDELLPLEFEAVVQETELSRSQTIEEMVTELEKGVEAYNRVKQIALKLTGPEDWVDMGGHPYLLESGAQKVAKAFGVQIGKVSLELQWQEDSKGKYQVALARGSAFSRKLGSYIEDIGACSQRDKLYAMRGVELIPIEEVDITMVMKKAIANLYGRLIKRVVGLMGVSWENLDSAGIKPAAKVEYKKKISEEAKKIGEMVLEMAGGDKEGAKKMLQSLSEFEKNGRKYYASSVSDLSEAWAKKLLPKVEKAHKEWKEIGNEPGIQD